MVNPIFKDGKWWRLLVSADDFSVTAEPVSGEMHWSAANTPEEPAPNSPAMGSVTITRGVILQAPEPDGTMKPHYIAISTPGRPGEVLESTKLLTVQTLSKLGVFGFGGSMPNADIQAELGDKVNL